MINIDGYLLQNFNFQCIQFFFFDNIRVVTNRMVVSNKRKFRNPFISN